MLHRSRPAAAAAELPQLVPNMRVRHDLETLGPEQPDPNGRCYLVRDGDGNLRDTGAVTRREALRSLGTFAVRGVSAPLILLAPDGQPTGDRLG